jgi:cytochrome b subunit of formate dehydrogenase
MSEARIVRHRLVDRLFHWVMAASMLALMATGLSVAVELEFSWLTIHWIAGLILTLAVALHTVRALFWQSLRSMWIAPSEVASVLSPQKPGKYSLAQRGMHHAVTVFCLAAIVTGLLMLKKVDTPLVARDPYWLAADTWGLIYVVHGLAALVFVSLIVLHVYFALRPEKLFYLRAMVFGWITPAERNANHDPALWRGEGS